MVATGDVMTGGEVVAATALVLTTRLPTAMFLHYYGDSQV